jgi:hypothetical protein
MGIVEVENRGICALVKTSTCFAVSFSDIYSCAAGCGARWPTWKND